MDTKTLADAVERLVPPLESLLLVAAQQTKFMCLRFESVGLLAAIVAIRTFLSFSLETEIERCWPWQRAAKDAGRPSGIEADC